MRAWPTIMQRAYPVIRDCVGLAGAAAISYGAWMIHPAAGFIVGGLFALCGAVLLAWLEGPTKAES